MPIPPSRATRLRPVTTQAARSGRALAHTLTVRTVAAVRRARTGLFLTGACACLTGAAFTAATWAGLTVAGVSLLFLEFMSGPAK